MLLAGALAVSTGTFTIARAARDTLVYAFFLHGMSGATVLSFNGALWSMATESQFYVAFPVLLALYARVGRLRFVGILGLVNLTYRVGILMLPDVHRSAAGVDVSSIDVAALLALQLPGRCLEFGLGMALADLYVNERERARRWFRPLLAVSLPVALLVRLRGPAPLVEMLFGVLFLALVGTLIMPPPRAGAEAGPLGRGMAAFGRASYSFFLLHAPALVVARLLFPSLGPFVPHPEPYRDYLLLLAVAFPLALAAAVLLYRGVELPLWARLRVSSRRGAPSSTVAPAVATVSARSEG